MDFFTFIHALNSDEQTIAWFALIYAIYKIFVIVLYITLPFAIIKIKENTKSMNEKLNAITAALEKNGVKIDEAKTDNTDINE